MPGGTEIRVLRKEDVHKSQGKEAKGQRRGFSELIFRRLLAHLRLLTRELLSTFEFEVTCSVRNMQVFQDSGSQQPQSCRSSYLKAKGCREHKEANELACTRGLAMGSGWGGCTLTLRPSLFLVLRKQYLGWMSILVRPLQVSLCAQPVCLQRSQEVLPPAS